MEMQQLMLRTACLPTALCVSSRRVDLQCLYLQLECSSIQDSSLAGPRVPAGCRSLVEQEAAKQDVFGVQRQLREGNCDLAAVNLSRESELGELRNHIAIVRCSTCPTMRQSAETQNT